MSHWNKENAKRKPEEAQHHNFKRLSKMLKTTVSATIQDDDQAPLTLTTMPEKNLVHVLSYLHYYERSKTRSVCHQCLKVVDSMPISNKTTLRIRLFAAANGPSYAIRRDQKRNIVKLSINMYGKNIGQVIQGLPALNRIRPCRLDVASTVSSNATTIGVEPSMLHCLATAVGGNLSHLHIKNLACSSLVDLQEAFSAFEAQSGTKNGVMTHVTLEDSHCPLAHAISALTFLRGLEDLNLEITQDMLLGWQYQADSIGLHLSGLSKLARLRSVSIPVQALAFGTDPSIGPLHKAAMSSFVLGLSTVTHLKSISCSLVGYCPLAATTLLRRLPYLESLKWLSASHVHLVGGHASLKELGIFCMGEHVNKHVFEACATACLSAFPALTKLELQFQQAFPLELIPYLVLLKNHASLACISLYFGGTSSAVDMEGFGKTCKAVFGEGIAVRVYTQ